MIFLVVYLYYYFYYNDYILIDVTLDRRWFLIEKKMAVSGRVATRSRERFVGELEMESCHGAC